MTEELKPCPFCGGDELTFDKDTVWPDEIHMMWVCCHGDECECRGPRAFWYSNLDDAKDAAVILWNTRADMEKSDENSGQD